MSRKRSKALPRYRPTWGQGFLDLTHFTHHSTLPIERVTERVRGLTDKVADRRYFVDLRVVEDNQVDFVISIIPSKPHKRLSVAKQAQGYVRGIIAEIGDGRVVVDGVIHTTQRTMLQTSIAASLFVIILVMWAAYWLTPEVTTASNQLACLVFLAPLIVALSYPIIKYHIMKHEVLQRIETAVADLQVDK